MGLAHRISKDWSQIKIAFCRTDSSIDSDHCIEPSTLKKAILVVHLVQGFSFVINLPKIQVDSLIVAVIIVSCRITQ